MLCYSNRSLSPGTRSLMFEFFAINRYLDTGRRYFWALVNFYGPHILRQLPREEDRGRGSALDIYVRGLVQSGGLALLDHSSISHNVS